MFKIDNIRFGNATNSSSTHSVLMFKIPMEEVFEKIGNVLVDSPSYYDHYGWEDFLLVSKEEKLAYLVSQLYHIFESHARFNWDYFDYGFMMEDTKEFITKCVVKMFKEYMDEDVSGIEICGIDHQSCLSVPRDIKTGYYCWDYFFDMCKAVIRSGAIIGGNDNSCGSEHQYLSNYDFAVDMDTGGTLVKKSGDWYTLFWDGNKLRLSFEENPKPFKGSDTPELLDIKITNYCEHGCSFCYQGAEKKWVEQTYTPYHVYSIINKLNPFEVVFGGGEILQHEKDVEYFEKLIYGISDRISLGVTVKDVKVLEKLKAETYKRLSAIGISVSSAEEVKTKADQFLNLGKEKGFRTWGKHMVFHITMGTVTEEEFVKMLGVIANEYYYFKILLLGFKDVGRGKNYKPIEYKSWLPKHIKNFTKVTQRISADTKLASELEEAFRFMGVVSESYFTEEGYVSAYIDAVKGEVGISSYDKTYPIESGYRVEENVKNKIKELMDAVKGNKK